MNDQHILELYLTEYRPDLRAELLRSGNLPAYLEEQAAAMAQARLQLLSDLKTHSPSLSQAQIALEADQQIREMFLPLT